jgi:hypothetical protein
LFGGSKNLKPEPGKLVAAAHDNKFDLVRQFLAEGGDVDERDEWGGTALGYALAAHDEDAMRLLLEHGANVNTPDNQGHTPMYYSVLWYCPVSFVELCLAHGGSVTVRELGLIDDQEIAGVGEKDVHQLLRYVYKQYHYPGADPSLWSSKRIE